MLNWSSVLTQLEGINGKIEGRVASVTARGAEIKGMSQHLSLGDRVWLQSREGKSALAEIAAFRGDNAQVMAFEALHNFGPGSAANAGFPVALPGLSITEQWLGRVIDPLGRPLDDRGPLQSGPRLYPIHNSPPTATKRARLGAQLGLGVRALDIFTPCQIGQRLGLFAGPGVGKSTLLAMLARFAQCDVIVLALVGERGREVREFIEDGLGRIGLGRCVVIVATSDATPLMRREAAYAAMTVSEYFRDSGKKVLLLVDSITRFCSALRDIALAAGELPATRGYPPSVFAELPRLLERAGPGWSAGHKDGAITAFFTVLVEGDDFHEPVADAARGLLDGHIILDRGIAEAGRYPAVDVLKSLSRGSPVGQTLDETALAQRARRILAKHAEISDIVRLGAYQPGNDAAADEAIATAPAIERILVQGADEFVTAKESFAALRAVMSGV